MMILPDRPLTQAVIYRTVPQEAKLWYDTDKERIVVTLRWIRRDLAKAEFTTLADFDPVRRKWCTELAKHYDEVEGWRACDKLFGDVFHLVSSSLEKDIRNSNWQRSWWYPKK